jgi:hypothetical protein
VSLRQWSQIQALSREINGFLLFTLLAFGDDFLPLNPLIYTSCQQRNTSATLQACAKHPTGVKGASGYVPVNNGAERQEEFIEERPVSCSFQVAIKRMEHPERRINGVVLRRLATIRETVRNKPTVREL